MKLEDKYEERLRQETARLGISLSELIRRNLMKPAESGSQDKAAQLTAEVLELRKEMRIITGALVKIMQANGLSIEEMKQAGKEFYRERV
ncbi:MAG: ribbon-helix-helix protein, CopG family [Selenomonadaceae bacterium]|nr:ribbon-helix-helix protein, CopG family [Selenomonadaceae bacterium]